MTDDYQRIRPGFGFGGFGRPGFGFGRPGFGFGFGRPGLGLGLGFLGGLAAGALLAPGPGFGYYHLPLLSAITVSTISLRVKL